MTTRQQVSDERETPFSDGAQGDAKSPSSNQVQPESPPANGLGSDRVAFLTDSQKEVPVEGPPEVDPKGNLGQFSVSVYPGRATTLPPDIAGPFVDLRKQLDMPLWLLVQNGRQMIDYQLYQSLFLQRHLIAENKPVAILIDSPGGDAHAAYMIGRLFQRRTKDLTTVIPGYAKSAATLLALSGSALLLGRDAELGPVDVQILDPDREDLGSALDAVQALERLNAFSLLAIDQAMKLLLGRTGKKIDTLLPHVLEYAASLVRPLLESIDSVDYTRKSRDLNIAEEYAVRLMKRTYGEAQAKEIAAELVERYPTHVFVIDAEEAEDIGIQSCRSDLGLSEVEDVLCRLRQERASLTGLLDEKQGEEDTPESGPVSDGTRGVQP